jgi:hypothetical protein
MSWLGQVCVCDAAFINIMNGFDDVWCLPFSIVVNTDIFSDAVEPAVKGSVGAEGVDGAKCF